MYLESYALNNVCIFALIMQVIQKYSYRLICLKLILISDIKNTRIVFK